MSDGKMALHTALRIIKEMADEEYRAADLSEEHGGFRHHFRRAEALATVREEFRRHDGSFGDEDLTDHDEDEQT